MKLSYVVGQWLRAIKGDHDVLLSTPAKVDRVQPKVLTRKEIEEGMSL